MEGQGCLKEEQSLHAFRSGLSKKTTARSTSKSSINRNSYFTHPSINLPVAFRYFDSRAIPGSSPVEILEQSISDCKKALSKSYNGDWIFSPGSRESFILFVACDLNNDSRISVTMLSSKVVFEDLFTDFIVETASGAMPVVDLIEILYRRVKPVFL